jgi:hypothetical protein
LTIVTKYLAFLSFILADRYGQSALPEVFQPATRNAQRATVFYPNR